MIASISFFLSQWPLFWALLALFFFALGLWWAYLTWCKDYVDRIAAAKLQFERLQQAHSNTSAGDSATSTTAEQQSHITKRSAATVAAADSKGISAESHLNSRNESNRESPNVVEWDGLPGIDSKLASELKSMGIKSPDQLAAMNSADRNAFQQELQAKGLQWDWNWLSGWKGIATGATAATALTQLPSLLLPKTNAPAVKWAGLPGINDGVAKDLENLGIRNPEQLNALSSADREKLETHFRTKGLDWDWNWVKGWTTATGSVSAGSAPTKKHNSSVKAPPPPVVVPRSDAPNTNWKKLNGVDERLANAFQASGIKNVDQLEKMGPDERKKLELQLASQGINWDWTWMKNWIGDAVERPRIKPQFDTSSSALRAKTIRQTTQSTRAASGSDATSSGSTASSTGSFSGQQAAAVTGLTALAASLSIPRLRGPKTEWHRIHGADDRLIAAFDKLGIHSFEQIENMHPADRNKLAAGLAANGINWDWTWMRNWRADASPRVFTAPQFATTSATRVRRPATNADVATPSNKNTSIKRASNEKAAAKAGWALLPGIDPAVAAELNASGFRSVEELENLPYEQRRAWESQLRNKNIRWDWSWILKWKNAFPAVAQAMDANSKTKKFVSDAPPPAGLLSAPINGQADDLKRVKGIGPVFEETLNQRGVYHFHQLAAFTRSDVEWMASQIDCFPDRIDRDNWIEQAKQLARGAS